MTTSNRERVGRGFEILSSGLAPFVQEVMAAASPAGDRWLELIEARDSERFGAPRKFNPEDPQVLLRTLTEEWRVFKDRLSRSEQAFASELREVRNHWAHNDPFDPDDTYRALDSMERLLIAVGGGTYADEVRKLRMDHQRAHYESETKKAVKAAAVASVPGSGLKSWRDVISPHDDVARGQYNAAEFAADLHMVAMGEGSPEYVDSFEFFRRTFLTEGLRDLLSRAARRLSGDTNASPVVNLQTNFGGGKTHSMLALYHLCSGHPIADYPQDVQEALAGTDLTKLGTIKRVALVGTHLMPGVPSIKPDGTQVRTIWGELAWQLGGRPAYDLVAEADRTATNPGTALSTLITANAPCLILIDEWVAYARQLHDREDLVAGTFETQFTFAQTLTEVVKSIPGALLIISIPASDRASDEDGSVGSDVEVGGPNGQEALKRLQNVVRRVADQWRPASAYEAFEIVRRRLFKEPDAAARADIAAVARQFSKFYLEHRGEFPRECGDPGYEDRIRAAYPIHPELFDRLYEDWSTLERFQRTRGVLRLMSTVVHALWAAGDAGPMIMAGSVPLDLPAVTSELTQYLPDSWKPIIDADVDGVGSTPVQIDSERPTFGGRSVSRRIARSIFIGSAPTLHGAHKGIERQHVWLGAAIPGDTVGNFGSAVEVLAQRASYLYVDAGRYWFDTQASVTRTAQDYADRLRDRPEEVWAEIVRRLGAARGDRGDFASVHTCPEDTGAVPDSEEGRLVILHPRLLHTRGAADSDAQRFAQHCLDSRGSAQRVNRNTLVFLAPDDRRMEELSEATRDFLAWSDICSRATELELKPQQKTQAERRRDQSAEAVSLRIAETYIWAFVPEQPDPSRPAGWQVYKAEGSAEHLADRVSAKLRQSGLFATVYGARNIRMDLDGPLRTSWSAGHISVGELWTYYCRYPYLSRLRDRRVLDDAVSSALDDIMWQSEAFALASNFDSATSTYVGLAIPHSDRFGQVTDTTLIVAPEVALKQRERDLPSGESGAIPDAAGAAPAAEASDLGEPAAVGAVVPLPVQPTRFFGTVRLNPERYSRDMTRVAQEILQHLAADEGVELEVSIEIQATQTEGFTDDRIRTITENARVLKFEAFGFEDE